MSEISLPDAVEVALELLGKNGGVVIGGNSATNNLRWANSALTTNGDSIDQTLSISAFVSMSGGVATGMSSGQIRSRDDVEALVAASKASAVSAGPAVDAMELVAGPTDKNFADAALTLDVSEISHVAGGLAEVFAYREQEFFGYAEQSLDTTYVGPSGAGKSTISALIPRLYDTTSGSVKLSGVDVKDVTQESLHRVVGVVMQDAHMYHDTIRANLLYANTEASETEIWSACESAQIAEMIRSLPEGLDTVVGDRGHRLSGGEKQRLAIARLLLKAPDVVVLDEATAHLDSENESAVQAALAIALQGRTSIVVAHRLSTIRQANQILVIDDGRIVQRGTHEELLATGGVYADLYHRQFAEDKS